MPTSTMNQQNTKAPYFLHKKIKETLGKGKIQLVKYDQDRVVMITGREGSGKSTLAMQCAYEVDPTFSLKDIVFNSKDFSDRIRNANRYKAIVFDEAFNGLSSRGALTKENKYLVRLLQECRQRNLFIFIVLPSIFLLEKYVAVFRSHYLLHCKINQRNPSNRFAQLFNFSNKQVLYILGKKMMSYSRPKIKMKYTFSGKFPPSIDRKEYEAKKLVSFKEEDKVETREVKLYNKYSNMLGLVLKLLKETYKLPYTKQKVFFESKGVDISSPHISDLALKTSKSKD